MMNNIFVVKALVSGVGYYQEFDDIFEAMDYYEELTSLNINSEVELLKVSTLSKKGEHQFE